MLKEFDIEKFGKGALEDIKDERDYLYDDILAAGNLVSDKEWLEGYDIEKVINAKIPFKNQWGSLSCVGQAFSYYVAVKNAIEIGKYIDVSAKAIYSQIAMPSGGSYFRDAAKLVVSWGALLESKLNSYKQDGSTDEPFMREKEWLNEQISQEAKTLGAKEYRTIGNLTMDMFASAIRDGQGMVAGVYGSNNGSWGTNEPKPPTEGTEWAHALFFGKFGTDEKGRYIATPNSWGTRGTDKLHPDGWQKLRAEWFAFAGVYLFAPWVLIDKPNNLTNQINMVAIKQKGQPAIYLQAGDVLIPFTNWDAYTTDFASAKIVELPEAEFKKYTIAKANVITKK